MTDFKAFGASPTASVFGTAVQSTPFSLAGGKAAFGGVRNNGRSTTFDDDEDDDDEEDDEEMPGLEGDEAKAGAQKDGGKKIEEVE